MAQAEPRQAAHDPFLILGIEPRFDLDLVMVAERHRELSRALHPDRFVGAAPGERRQALNRAIEVNEAWRAVKDPVKRAEALLRNHGVAVSEQSDHKPSQDLLLEMMEAREELGSLKAAGDAAKLQHWRVQQEQRRDAVCASLTQRFASAAVGGDVAPVREQLVELRYLQRLLEEARNAEDEVG